MRPRRWAVGVGQMAVVVVAVTLAVVVVSLRMILCVHIGGLSCFMKRRNLWMDLRTDPRTDQRTDGRRDPLIEMRGRI